MKKVFFILSCLLAVGFVNVSCGDDDDDEVTITADALPNNAKTFIATHFPTATITHVEQNRRADEDGTIYEVRLNNGFKVDFNADGVWTDVDGNYQAIPSSIIALLPANISTYVSTNHPNASITDIERKHYGYAIDLSNNAELRFNHNGDFLGYDN